MSMETIDRDGGRVCLTVHPDDNVATLLDSAVATTRTATGLQIVSGVPFGHKIALRDISSGAEVIKYGVCIGRAMRDIAAGDHVHVQNCA